MQRKDQTDRCSFLPDRIFGLNIRPMCKAHDHWYETTDNLLVKLVGDVILAAELTASGTEYAIEYKSESTSKIGKTLRKIGIVAVMPPLMFALGAASLPATFTVGTAKWLYSRSKK